MFKHAWRWLLCCIAKHRHKKVWEGKVEYDGKRNKEPLEFKGDWRVLRCKRCNKESYEKL